MNVILSGARYIQGDFCKTKRVESMHYLLAIVCVIALVVINVYGKESSDINGILGAAIAGLVYGGIQRGQAEKKNPRDGGED